MGLGKKVVTFVAAAAILGLFSGCNYIFGEDVVGGDDDDVPGPVADGRVLVDITSDTLLKNTISDPNKADYIIEDYIDVSAKLTIEPGVVIMAKSDRSLTITSAGSIVAQGTIQAPIRFIGESNSAGFWRGIRIESNSTYNELDSVEISNTGSSGAGLIISDGAQAKITNCTFRKNSKFALDVNGTLGAFARNRFEDNSGGDVEVIPNQAGMLDSNSFFGTKVTVTGGSITRSCTWQNLNVPYSAGYIVAEEGTFTILPGVRLVFSSDSWFKIEPDAVFVAVGTELQRISFSGANEAMGFWRGLEVSSGSTLNEISFVDISSAGGANGGAVKLWDNSRLKITNCRITGNQNAAIAVNLSASLPAFSANTLSGNQISMSISAKHIGSLDVLTDYSGNTENDAVVVNSSDVSGTSNIWKAINVPYIFSSYTNIIGKVTVLPGAKLIFKHDSDISVDEDGVLVAVGTPDSIISFVGMRDDDQGTWRGIQINTPSTENELSYCDIASGGIGGSGGNINVWDDARVKVTNCTIRQSDGYGIFRRASANVTESDNEFLGCALGQISN